MIYVGPSFSKLEYDDSQLCRGPASLLTLLSVGLVFHNVLRRLTLDYTASLPVKWVSLN